MTRETPLRRVLVASLACLLWATADAAGGRDTSPAPGLQRVASGVYVLPAHEPGPPAARNAGLTQNAGVLLGPEGVVVIDPGPNQLAGRRLMQRIRRITRLPVVAVILTHAHPENVLAAAAVAGDSAPVIAHARTYALMRERCSECLTRLTRLVGERAMQGTAIRVPDQTIADGATIRRYGGRELLMMHVAWGHTAGDLAVLDKASGTLFTGGVASNRVMPDLHEGRTRGWIEALRTLEALVPTHVIPAEGVHGGPELLTQTRTYLSTLLGWVEATYHAQGSVFELLANSDMPAYADWARYADTQPLNIQHVYAELEKEDFAAR